MASTFSFAFFCSFIAFISIFSFFARDRVLEIFEFFTTLAFLWTEAFEICEKFLFLHCKTFDVNGYSASHDSKAGMARLMNSSKSGTVKAISP